MMHYRKAIEFLIENGCPSIVYRTKKEILKEKLSKQENEYYQNQILQDNRVRYVLSLQKDDGWLGKNFHGEDEPESCIRLLCEKGIDVKTPALLRALSAIENRGDQFDQGCLYRVGKLLDENNLGGSQMIKVCVYSYAGIDNTNFMKTQIEKALNAFQFVTTINHPNEICRIKSGKLVFATGVPWPSIYHLRLLAFTDSWKNQLSAKDWMMWFHRIELISRIGLTKEIPAFSQQIEQLEHILKQKDGIFDQKLSHYYFHKWTSYIELALENNWKHKNARACDLTFRSLLILGLSEKL